MHLFHGVLPYVYHKLHKKADCAGIKTLAVHMVINCGMFCCIVLLPFFECVAIH